MGNQIMLSLCLLLLLFSYVTAYPVNTDTDGLIENDILISRNIDGSTDDADSIVRHANKWQGGVVYYAYSGEFDSDMIRKVSIAMAKIESTTCVKFLQKTDQTDYINFVQNGNRCYSYIGRIGGAQSISLPDWCLNDHDGILHELLHALGFEHEHNRHDRDDYIAIDWHNVMAVQGSNAIRNWQKRDESELEYFGTDYDYKSVMHYPASSMGRTIVTPKRTETIGSNGLSDKDVHKIKKHYQCPTTDIVTGRGTGGTGTGGTGTGGSGTVGTGTGDGGTGGTGNGSSGTGGTATGRGNTIKQTCMDGFYYCGSELISKGFRDVASIHHLYQCKNNQMYYHHKCGQGLCTKPGMKSAYCACKVGTHYCGYKLFLRNWGDEYDNPNGGQVLYKCTGRNRVARIENCSGHCHAGGQPHCSGGLSINYCSVGKMYCGYELSARKFTGIKSQYLYECKRKRESRDTFEVIGTKRCAKGCTEDGTNSYCAA